MLLRNGQICLKRASQISERQLADVVIGCLNECLCCGGVVLMDSSAAVRSPCQDDHAIHLDWSLMLVSAPPVFPSSVPKHRSEALTCAKSWRD